MSPFLLVPTNDSQLMLSTFRAVTGYVEAQVRCIMIRVIVIMTTG